MLGEYICISGLMLSPFLISIDLSGRATLYCIVQAIYMYDVRMSLIRNLFLRMDLYVYFF